MKPLLGTCRGGPYDGKEMISGTAHTPVDELVPSNSGPLCQFISAEWKEKHPEIVRGHYDYVAGQWIWHEQS